MLEKTNKGSNELSRESRLLLLLNFGFAVSTSMSGTFLTIYLWKLTESWVVNGIYNISLFVFVVIGFILGGWLSKKKDRLITFRLGICMMAIFFLSVILLQEKVAEYPALFGMINGLAQGFYWIAMLVLAYDVTNNDNRLKYFGWETGMIALAGIIGPFMSGYIIEWFADLMGYMVVFGISFGLFILIIAGSFLLKQEVFRSQTFLLSFVFRRSFKKKVWKLHFLGWFIMGLWEGAMLLLPPILLYQMVQKESIVGLLMVLFGIINIASGQFLGIYGKKEYNANYSLSAAIGLTLGTFILIWKVNFFTVVIFMMANAFFSPVQRISYTNFMYGLVSALPNKGKKLKTELIATRQIFLTLGRVLTVVFFMLYVVGMDYHIIVTILAVASVTQFILYFVMNENRPVTASSDYSV